MIGNTTNKPATINIDNSVATFLTIAVPKIATRKMKTPIIAVQSIYGTPVSVFRVEPPVEKATAGTTSRTKIYTISNSGEKIFENFP